MRWRRKTECIWNIRLNSSIGVHQLKYGCFDFTIEGYTVTNLQTIFHSLTYGAAALFLPGIIERIHERLGEPFFAIPSSIHEFLIIPESSGVTMSVLNSMCREANQTVVRYNEILSDNVLYMPYNK
ncbi:DUF5688 family protein [Blautia sp.]|uniref:DUF5688 family protein n=1 Tax=Blautia sp. TaxID=1955243 RepID=UPI003FA42C5F